MGALTATDFATHATSLDAAISMHLTSNCFPPIHPDFHPVAQDAVARAIDAETSEEYDGYDEVLSLPNGVQLSVSEVISQLHLDAFVEAGVYEALHGLEET